jgi:hypothetical protein
MISMSDFKTEPGWNGAFMRKQAEGAIPNGTRIVKINAEAEDAHQNGTPGVVLGSMMHPEIMNGAYFYFVEWAPKPRTAVGVMGMKIRVADA